MKKQLFIISIVMIAIFLFLGAVSASSMNNSTVKKPVSISNAQKVNVANSTQKIIKGSGCCSVLVHVKKGHDVFAFRRDSTYTANLYFKRSKWYGKDTIKEYKKVNGYFFHTIISTGGWIIATGGPDIPYLNRKLEALAGRTSISGHITKKTLNSAYSILRKEGMGHFIIKAPNDLVGLVIYNGGKTKKTLFKMNNGRYVSVPNSPIFYRSGYTNKIDPVSSAIHIETTDRWGLNRRNIITYNVTSTYFSTNVKIWASTCRRTPDNIIFGGKKIGKYTLPHIPNKKFIGKLDLKNPKIASTTPYNLQNDVIKNSPIVIRFSENIKPSTLYNSIQVKNLNTNIYLTITKTIGGNILNLSSFIDYSPNTWYSVKIPQFSIADYKGNNLLSTYIYTFKTSA
jgi:Bacterial Ig-like domain